MLQIRQKQQTVIDAINNPAYDTIVLIGAVGTGKTDIAAFAVLSICKTFPKTRWVVVRQNISTALKTVVPSYLEMADRMELIQGKHFKYNGQNHIIYMTQNQSEIYFIEADITKDRQGRKIKGINSSGNHIDEADELEETMFITATSRKGRRNDSGQPSISIITMNPNDTFLKEKYYDPFKKGTLPPNVCVIEFDITDSWQSEADVDALKSNPEWWTQRYLYNNWEYQDESKTLFKSELFARALAEKLEDGSKTVGYDVAREGSDRSVSADWEGWTLSNIEIVKDTKDKMDTDDQARWLINHSDERSVGYENIAVDGVGIGVGILDSGKILGAVFAVYKSGFAPDPYLSFNEHAPTKGEAERAIESISFNNLRSQMAYNFAMGMERGTIKILKSCPFRSQLISEAQQHHFEVKDKVLILESKESIKKRTGKSPDIFDAVIMGLWKQMKKKKKVEMSFG